MVVRVHFTDYFGVPPAVLDQYGAFNVSLVNDLPLFIDPFLLFGSDRSDYQQLHQEVLSYLRFLKDKAAGGRLSSGELEAWFTFHEVRQNWLGFSTVGNSGLGLGFGFAKSLAENLDSVFKDFGAEEVTTSSHLEKLALIDDGVGRDKISDFTTNLVKGYLLEYTQEFAKAHLSEGDRSRFTVQRVRFDYRLESWAGGTYELPSFKGDFVLLTPRNLLTRDDTWISRRGYVDSLEGVIQSVSNQEIRAKLNNYLQKALPDEPTRDDFALAATRLARRFPEVLDYFIRLRENTGEAAIDRSEGLVQETADLFVKQIREFVDLLQRETPFFSIGTDTQDEAMQRVRFFKDVVENKGGHRLFWVGEKAVHRESDVHILYRLTWFGTDSDVSREVNDGRGPADFKVSRGSADKTIVEFKIASNTKLEQNLKNQTAVYQKASDASGVIKVILYFTEKQFDRVKSILKRLDLSADPDVVLVDARRDNKPSGSRA